MKRVTPRDTRLVDFTDGSFLSENELDLSATQLLYIIQEVLDDLTDALHYDFSADKYDAQGKPITNVGDPIDDADVVTLNYYKTVVLPALLKVVNDAIDAFIAPITDELEQYRTLLEEYKNQLDAATTAAIDTADAAIETINGMVSDFDTKHSDAVGDITRIADASTEAIQTLADGKEQNLQNIADTAESKYTEYLAELNAILSEMLSYKNSVQQSVADGKAARDEAKAIAADMKDFCYMGDWKSGTVYRPQNVVYHGGSSYVLTKGDGTTEPASLPAAADGWQFMAQKGENCYVALIDGGAPDTEFIAVLDGGGPEPF